MENLEQLQRNMMWIFENKQEIPLEVLQVAQGMFNGLEEKYEQLGCNNEEIQQYMQNNLDGLIDGLQAGIGNRRKDEQFEEIQNFLSYANKKASQEEIPEKIGEISSNQAKNIRVTLNTIDKIEESLKNIQAKQNKILYEKRKFTGEQINKINEEALKCIADLRNQNENKVYNCFQVDNVELRNELLQAYEEYTGQRKEGDKR